MYRYRLSELTKFLTYDIIKKKSYIRRGKMYSFLFFSGIVLAIVAFVFALMLISTVFKRLIFFAKLSGVCRKNGYGITGMHALRSMFKRDGEADAVISSAFSTYRVYVFTTVFKRTRYHLDGDKVIIYRKRLKINRADITFSHRSGILGDNMEFKAINEAKFITVKNFDFPAPVKNEKVIFCVMPIPLAITVDRGNKPYQLYSGEEIVDGVYMYSGKGLRDMLNSQK